MAHENISKRVDLVNTILLAEGAEFKVVCDLRFKDGKVRTCLKLTSEESNISPTIYPDEEIENLSNEELARHLIRLYKDAKVGSIDPSEFMNKDYILKNVLPRARKEDEEQDIYEKAHYAYVKELNILYTFYIPVTIGAPGKASITLTWDHIVAAGIDMEEMIWCAEANVAKIATVETMFDKMKKMLDEDMLAYIYEPAMEDIYVVTVQDSIFGAGLLKSTEYLDILRSHYGDFVILPSTIHEFLLIPVENHAFSPDAKAYEMMVREVNSAEVSEEERLSDTPYFFRGDHLEYLTDELLRN
ncbi:MAG: hypothetical protein IKS07_02250 [Lachnospiraceae bacterium]|nr:hypothetical protein [Lachnospiraceae bacterium]